MLLHGVIVRADGTEVNVRLGDEPGDPVFCISDLLPHLAKEQNGKTLGTAFAGEGLNAIFGSEPMSEGDEKVKENLLRLLNEKYGICEEDFISSEPVLCSRAERRGRRA